MKKRFVLLYKLIKKPKFIHNFHFSATLLLIIFCFSKLEAQQANSFSNIQYITSNEGLSQSEVTCIIQDKKGFIWIGTRGGLNRYDGSNIKTYQNEIGNSNSLINNSVEALFEDSIGHIWIGTKSNGVSRFIPELDKFEQAGTKLDSLQEKNVISIEESSTNTIWLGTRKNGLYIFNTKENSISHLLGNQTVSDILKTKDGEMWVGTPNGAYVYDKKGNFIEHLQIGSVSSIVEDEQSGLMYYVSWGTGLISYNPISKIITPHELNINNVAISNVHYLYQDNERNIWIGSWGGGVYRFKPDSQKITHFNLYTPQTKGSSELYNDVLFIYQDRLGILWFGTNGGGLCKVDKSIQQFGSTVFNNIENSLPNKPIWSIFKDRDDHLLVGIKGNNYIYYSLDDKHFNKIELSGESLNNLRNKKDGIKVIYQDLKGSIWVGGNYDLFKIKKTENSFKINSSNLKINDNSNIKRSYKITSLHQTTDSIFWIGTQQNGLKKSIGIGNPENQVFEQHLEEERISAFIEDRTGKIWVGTYRGIQLYQPKTNSFKRYHKTNEKSGSLSSDIIICLFEDSKGNIWIGTPNGLNLAIRNDDNSLTFKSFQVKDGLPNNYIHAILEDNSENLWISTNKGISQFNINDSSFYNYDVNDGLQSNSFMEGSAFKDAKGKLFFGGIYGLNNFHPNSIKKNLLPPVILTGLKVSGQEIHPEEKYNDRYILKNAIEHAKEITLTYKENIFSIEYAALDLSSTSNSYKFKMEGLDTDWQATTSQKNVTYSNLDAGAYEFKVKTVYGEGDSDASVTSLKIKILPPLWKTWPAFILYISVFIGLLYLYSYFIKRQHDLVTKLNLAKSNRKKEKELAEMKTRFFTNIAHEIRTPLSLITGPIETLIKNSLNKEQQQNYLTTVDYHSKRLLNLVGQLLDFRKVESGKMTLQVANGDFAKFTNEIFLSFSELAKSKNILFKLDAKSENLQLTYDREKMEIVLCNLLSNAFKYATSKIEISLNIKKDTTQFPNGYCEVSVIDDGKGMPAKVMDKIFDRFYQIANTESISLIGTGIGLALVKNIVELHHGNVIVKSKIEEGSTFIVKIPLGDTHFKKNQFIQNFKKAEDPVHYQIERVLPNSSIENKTQTVSSLPSLLIIEDNPEIRTFVKSVFQENFKILEAENGILGLEKAKKHIPDVIISDLMMPEMDGLTLSAELKSIKETLHIPIIMLTARTTSIFQEKGYSSGVDIYVTKPFNPSVLKAQVTGLLNSRRKLKQYFSRNITLQPTESDAASLDQEFLNKSIKLVEDNLTNEKLNRDFLASRMAVSSSTLYRKIKSITDLDITIFIRSIRLKKAAQMIVNKEDTISGIAYQVGFNDPKYFRKCFVSQFGVTPSQFKKNNND